MESHCWSLTIVLMMFCTNSICAPFSNMADEIHTEQLCFPISTNITCNRNLVIHTTDGRLISSDQLVNNARQSHISVVKFNTRLILEKMLTSRSPGEVDLSTFVWVNDRVGAKIVSYPVNYEYLSLGTLIFEETNVDITFTNATIRDCFNDYKEVMLAMQTLIRNLVIIVIIMMQIIVLTTIGIVTNYGENEVIVLQVITALLFGMYVIDGFQKYYDCYANVWRTIVDAGESWQAGHDGEDFNEVNRDPNLQRNTLLRMRTDIPLQNPLVIYTELIPNLPEDLLFHVVNNCKKRSVQVAKIVSWNVVVGLFFAVALYTIISTHEYNEFTQVTKSMLTLALGAFPKLISIAFTTQEYATRQEAKQRRIWYVVFEYAERNEYNRVAMKPLWTNGYDTRLDSERSQVESRERHLISQLHDVVSCPLFELCIYLSLNIDI
ncbi:uncharacterized protein LOC117111853 isoform X3 [Anneissia japonica]|uniref:uncharacterized protein LOC117111853 isoform X3 n=1 Tax=Anneissia japonica TaxID=1529436 RepID=UPI001425AA0B|nr:uncharacterized protein LOC117111853 isoform X3 [Anneissia japonica]